MQFKILNTMLKTTAIAGLLLTSGLVSAQAVDVYLKAQQFEKQIPDGNGGFYPVEMWGFANCDSTFETCDAPASPGPQITADVGNTLTIHVSNTLPKMPVSIIIPGQGGAGNPTFMAPVHPDQPGRVVSMTQEAAPSDGTTDGRFDYTFALSKPGTYLYQSGSYPSLEVPMGLYGALVVRPNVNSCATAGESNAYGDADGVDCFAGESVLLFSEVDPIQNERLNDAIDPFVGNLDPTAACVPLTQYAATLEVGFPCTLDYNPAFLLVNGEPNASLGSAATGILPPSKILLRMVNAGLRSHTPSIVGVEMDLLAEDGNRYPGTVMQQSAVLLAAGKTIDALILASGDAETNVSFFDRMPTFSNENAPNGGALGTVFGPGTIPPVFDTLTANPDIYAFDENNSLSGKNVLDNDIGASGAQITSYGPATALDADGVPIAPGTFALDTNGALNYMAGANEVSTVTVPYTATAPDGRSGSSTVTLNVSFANGAPVAKDDAYSNTIGPNIDVAAPGVLANDVDPDGDNLVATMVTGPAGTISCVSVDPDTGITTTTPGTICSDGSFLFEPAGPGPDSFTYTINDGNGDSLEAVVSLQINAVSNISLSVVDESGTDVTDFRWTVEEDAMWQPDPNVDQPADVTQGANFHKSYMPVVAQGTGAIEFAALALDPAKHYYVSVLPAGSTTATPDNWTLTHGMGGARILPGQTSVTVNVNSQPTPYAQISIFVFNDNWPTNGAVDGNEQGLGGFQVSLEDAGGRYGASAGMMSQDADGNPLRNSLPCFGSDFNQEQPQAGIILSCPEGSATPGEVLITNLWPGKYGVIVTPPTNESADWVQTSTIEGTKVIDAWVKADEPAFFQEFGPAGWHVFTGFVKPAALAAPPAAATTSISGKVTNLHMSRPPNQDLIDSDSYNALAHTRAWVGVNSDAGVGPNIAAVQAAPDGTFTIDGVPAGQNYQLVVWDTYLDQVIAFQGVATPAPDATGAVAPVAVGNVPVFQWFARLENTVFLDENEDGVLPRDAAGDPLEPVLPEQNVNIRWRDGTVYAAAPTDTEGFVPFDQVFPFFHWLVAEVDYARFKPTGITATPDGGGVPDADGILNPNWPDGSPTTFTTPGPVLTQGFQAFLGQTNVIEWGKKPWAEGENGGISGIVYYASTRAENDPRLGVGEPWEPGVPNVTVRLYREVVRPDGTTALTLVDETQTDSWDAPDSLPSGCPGAHPDDQLIVGTGSTGANDKCYDGLRNFNQIRDAVFDGGYAFGATVEDRLPPGKYVVEVVPPPGYEIVKEQDVNVGFGEGFGVAPVTIPLPGGAVVAAVPDAATVIAAMSAEPGLAQPPCVGELSEVPATLSLFPEAQVEAPFAGAMRPLCDRKEVILSDQGQAAADFWLFTGAPIAAHFVGMILDDTAQEFNPLSIQFGEKWAPPFVPVSVRDYRGQEISRTYSDQWGRMNALVPSTFSANLPSPSGYSPSMLMTCMNDPGPIRDTNIASDTYGQMIVDPQYNPAYSNFCYTFQYMPGTTTYLDTPVLPVSAFASGYNPPDCEPANGEPKISWVDVDGVPGPYAQISDTAGATLTIHAQGRTQVPNPAYEGPNAPGAAAGQTKTIERNFVFGPSGTVELNGTAMSVRTWSNTEIVVDIPPSTDLNALAPGAYQLVVTNGDGVSTTEAITVYVDDAAAPIFTTRRVSDGGSIQAAIDMAAEGELIIVEPGTYEEMLIMWKPVRLQGSGAGVTFINGAKRPTNALLDWRAKMDCLFGVSAAGCDGAAFDVVDALPNQIPGAAGFDTEEGAPITVVAVFDPAIDPPPGPAPQPPANSFLRASVSRIDGFSITGGDTGGGIFVNGYAHRLRITNNRIFGNAGSWHGGIRVGRPFLELPDPTIGQGANPRTYAFNTGLLIEHNAVTQNGGMDGAGGGISLMTGTDGYQVRNNFVCGNFTQGDGAGIGHLGLSDGGRISGNTIAFNQSFFQQTPVSGGGVFVGGEPAAVVGEVSYGAGNVRIDNNLIQGNEAASGHGGGIRTQYVNGFDVANSSRSNRWYQVRIDFNTVVNNVAGESGGGISLHDTANGLVQDNVIAHNDSTATAAGAFTNGPAQPSVNQPAGISSEPHSAALAGVLPAAADLFSNPTMSTNVIFENRSFHYEVVAGAGTLLPVLSQTNVGECVGGANIVDLGVLGDNTYELNPGDSTFIDPGFVSPYCNGGRSLLEPGAMFALPALDEGGATWIQVRYGPLQLLWGDYNVVP